MPFSATPARLIPQTQKRRRGEGVGVGEGSSQRTRAVPVEGAPQTANSEPSARFPFVFPTSPSLLSRECDPRMVLQINPPTGSFRAPVARSAPA